MEPKLPCIKEHNLCESDLGEFPIFQKRNDLYTHSQEALNPVKCKDTKLDTNSRIPKEKFQDEKQNMMISNKDRRRKVHFRELKHLPYSAIVNLTIFKNLNQKQNSYFGTGVLIGPHHVLTARHNVVDELGDWMNKIYVVPALDDDNKAHYGYGKAIKIYTFDNLYDDNAFDMALLIIDKSLGKNTGWMGMYAYHESQDLTQNKPFLSGYPSGYYETNGNKIFSRQGNFKEISAEILKYDIDAQKGDSGSPIWAYHRDLGYVVLGIHVTTGKDVNIGSRLSIRKFEMITKIIKDTWLYSAHKRW